jgi:hypothetical protein
MPKEVVGKLHVSNSIYLARNVFESYVISDIIVMDEAEHAFLIKMETSDDKYTFIFEDIYYMCRSFCEQMIHAGVERAFDNFQKK